MTSIVPLRRLTDIEGFMFLKSFVEKIDLISTEYMKAYEKLPELNGFFIGDQTPLMKPYFKQWVMESGFDIADIGYDSRGEKPVGGFPLFKKGSPKLWTEHFPVTYSLLRKVPNLHFAQFSIMSPNSHILPHHHTKTENSCVFHINLFDLRGKAIFSAGDQTIEYTQKGAYFIFNPHESHESINNSESYRVTLMMDFRPQEGFFNKMRARLNDWLKPGK